MKFRRKAQSDAVEDDGTFDDLVEEEEAVAEDLLADGPFDSEELLRFLHFLADRAGTPSATD